MTKALEVAGALIAAALLVVHAITNEKESY